VLAGRELADARADAAELLTSSGERLELTHGDDGQGGRTSSYVVDGDAFPCRLESNGRYPREETIAGAARSATRWLLLVGTDVDVEAGDRVRVDGRTFHVLGVHGGESLELLRKLDLELVEGA
jgi:hypothetical protein